MIKLWWLMWYFTRPNRPKEGNAPSWYTDELSRHHLVDYLWIEKHLFETCTQTFIRWYYSIVGRSIPENELFTVPQSDVDRHHRQRRKINDLIDKAIEKGYLIIRTPSPNTTSSEIYLTTNWRGRNFIKPHYFIEACAREFGYLASIAASFLFGAGGALLIVFWNKIIEFAIRVI